MKVTFGIRTDAEAETAGLDVSEHGMWGYPEFYIPVPGGYGTESHGHLGVTHAAGRHAAGASACSCRLARRAAVGGRACPPPPSAAGRALRSGARLHPQGEHGSEQGIVNPSLGAAAQARSHMLRAVRRSTRN